MPTNDSSLPIVTSMQHFAHHGLRQAYSKEKEKVATYILVQWAMIGQDSMHVQHTTFDQWGGRKWVVHYMYEWAEKTEYLHHTPWFTSFDSELYSYLQQHPNQQVHVLLESTVEQADDQKLYSEKAGVGGAGRSITTVHYYKKKIH